jgi:hypothetical protein
MIARIAIFLVLSSKIAACSLQHYYNASDNRRVDADPQLLATFQQHRAACEGEAAKARLNSVAGFLVQHVESETILRGCLAGKGYVVR